MTRKLRYRERRNSQKMQIRRSGFSGLTTKPSADVKYVPGAPGQTRQDERGPVLLPTSHSAPRQWGDRYEAPLVRCLESSDSNSDYDPRLQPA